MQGTSITTVVMSDDIVTSLDKSFVPEKEKAAEAKTLQAKDAASNAAAPSVPLARLARLNLPELPWIVAGLVAAAGHGFIARTFRATAMCPAEKSSSPCSRVSFPA